MVLSLMTLGGRPKRFYTLESPALQLNKKQIDALQRFRNKVDQRQYCFEKSRCLCGLDDGLIVAVRDRYALPVNTYICRSCGVIRTSPRMTSESLVKFYEEDYRSIYIGEERATDKFFCEQVERGKSLFLFVIKSIVSSNANKGVVLDVGCGAGGILTSFRNNGFSTYGCDLGGEYLEYGRSRGLVLEHGDFRCLEKYGPAKLIILSHVLEHFADPLREIKNLAALVAENGYIYVEVPGILNIHRVYGDTLLYLQNAHLYHYTLETLSSLMSFAGFELVKGDQRVRGLFKKSGKKPFNTNKREYYKVLSYLLLNEARTLIDNSFFNFSLDGLRHN